MRIFKKPELGAKEREIYLGSLEDKISDKEREWSRISQTLEINSTILDENFKKQSKLLTKQLEDIESELAIKRSERAELEIPLDARKNSLAEREQVILKKEESLESEKQTLLQRERECEIKLESIKNLSDELGEMRVKLLIREKKQESKDRLLADREMQHLILIQNWKEFETKSRNDLQSREYAVAIHEMNLQSEKDGHIWLNDQRGILSRAWKELTNKKK